MTVQAGHSINVDEQIICASISSFQSMSLDATWANQNSDEYQDTLGQLLVTIASINTGGLIMFLPSYSLLDKLVYRWTNGSVFRQLRELDVAICVEPKEGRDMQDEMNKYIRGIDKKPPHGSGKSVMIAVCRGKLSEGISLSDDYCRCVLIVGLPFASTKEKLTVLKRNYQNERHQKNSHYPNGNNWYTTQAFRAINQSIGRAIRHSKDWGLVFLLDPRFKIGNNQSQLSRWIRGNIDNYDSFEDAIIAVQTFVNRRNAIDGKNYGYRGSSSSTISCSDCTTATVMKTIPGIFANNSSSSSSVATMNNSSSNTLIVGATNTIDNHFKSVKVTSANADHNSTSVSMSRSSDANDAEVVFVSTSHYDSTAPAASVGTSKSRRPASRSLNTPNRSVGKRVKKGKGKADVVGDMNPL